MNEFAPKVILIRPNSRILNNPLTTEPLTQELLAANLIKAGITNVAIWDEIAKGEITQDELSKYNRVCVSADTPVYPRAKRIREMCQEVRSSGSGNILTMLGGAHASALPEKVLNDGWDVVCKGEGDLLIDKIVSGDQMGLVEGQRATNLDAIPFPARDLVDMNTYGLERHRSGKPTAAIFTSRGCPYSCIYCYKGIFGNKVYYRSVENTVAELEVIKNMGINQVAFFDDTFTLKPDRTLQLCDSMKDLEMKWSCNARVNTVSLPMLHAMKTAGCEKISFGLESVDPAVLEMINKRITLHQAESAIRNSKIAGVRSRLYLTFGYWEDSDASVDAALKFLYKVQPDEAQLALLIPLPGSQLYDVADRYEISLPEDLGEYYYAGVNGPHSFITHTKHLDPNQYILAVERYKKGIEEWRKQKNQDNTSLT